MRRLVLVFVFALTAMSASLASAQSQSDIRLQDRYFENLQSFYSQNSQDRSIMMQQTMQAANEAAAARREANSAAIQAGMWKAKYKVVSDDLEVCKRVLKKLEESIKAKDEKQTEVLVNQMWRALGVNK